MQLTFFYQFDKLPKVKCQKCKPKLMQFIHFFRPTLGWTWFSGTQSTVEVMSVTTDQPGETHKSRAIFSRWSNSIGDGPTCWLATQMQDCFLSPKMMRRLQTRHSIGRTTNELLKLIKMETWRMHFMKILISPAFDRWPL